MPGHFLATWRPLFYVFRELFEVYISLDENFTDAKLVMLQRELKAWTSQKLSKILAFLFISSYHPEGQASTMILRTVRSCFEQWFPTFYSICGELGVLLICWPLLTHPPVHCIWLETKNSHFQWAWKFPVSQLTFLKSSTLGRKNIDKASEIIPWFPYWTQFLSQHYSPVTK